MFKVAKNDRVNNLKEEDKQMVIYRKKEINEIREMEKIKNVKIYNQYIGIFSSYHNQLGLIHSKSIGEVFNKNLFFIKDIKEQYNKEEKSIIPFADADIYFKQP